MAILSAPDKCREISDRRHFQLAGDLEVLSRKYRFFKENPNGARREIWTKLKIVCATHLSNFHEWVLRTMQFGNRERSEGLRNSRNADGQETEPRRIGSGGGF